MNDVAIKKPKPISHTFTLTVQVDPLWVEYLVWHSDTFYSDRSGYWLRGVGHDDRDDGLGWLCWEGDEKCPHGKEPNREAAFAAWRASMPLPNNWFQLDRAAAIRAWGEGVKRWGVDWYEDVDSTREDTVVQLALLGEIRYG